MTKTIEISKEHLDYIKAILGHLSEYEALEILMGAKEFTTNKERKRHLDELIEKHEIDNGYNLKVWEFLNNQ